MRDVRATKCQENATRTRVAWAILALWLVMPFALKGSTQERRPRWSLALESAENRQRKAWQLSQDLKGYDVLRKSFEVENALLGLINGFPASLHVDLRSTNSELVNAVWWWNPLDKDGNPTYDWNTFLGVYRDASVVIAKHIWLEKWLDARPGRRVELHLFGKGIGETRFQLNNFILPLWREAGFAGQPAYSLLLRRGDSEWATLYVGTEERRALVASVNEPETSPRHWLDGLNVYFHPRCKPGDKSSHYVVVEPSGRWELREVVGCEP
jgi:hypothetical protein